MTTTLDAHGRIIDDQPRPLRTIESRPCNTAHCPVCGQVTNEAFKVRLPSTNLMRPGVLAVYWIEGHLQCYSQLGDAEMKWRESQNQWSYLC